MDHFKAANVGDRADVVDTSYKEPGTTGPYMAFLEWWMVVGEGGRLWRSPGDT